MSTKITAENPAATVEDLDREFGDAGKDIDVLTIAEKLGIPFEDGEMTDMAIRVCQLGEYFHRQGKQFVIQMGTEKYKYVPLVRQAFDAIFSDPEAELGGQNTDLFGNESDPELN